MKAPLTRHPSAGHAPPGTATPAAQATRFLSFFTPAAGPSGISTPEAGPSASSHPEAGPSNLSHPEAGSSEADQIANLGSRSGISVPEAGPSGFSAPEEGPPGDGVSLADQMGAGGRLFALLGALDFALRNLSALRSRGGPGRGGTPVGGLWFMVWGLGCRSLSAGLRAAEPHGQLKKFRQLKKWPSGIS